MRLSNRSALSTAIAEGKYHIYPAGKLVKVVKAELADDKMIVDFDVKKMVERITDIKLLSYEKNLRAILKEDLGTLCAHLSIIEEDYDFEKDHSEIMAHFPEILGYYFGLDNYELTPTKIVEYFFEGYSDIYKDADWFAFNVSPEESRSMKIPIGSYFKRNQVVPAHILISILHEKMHAVYSLLSEPVGVHRYSVWFEEGFCDVFAFLMCRRMFSDDLILLMERRFIKEVNSLDPRKATYHYGMILFINLLRSGGLAFVRTLLDVMKEYTYRIDMNRLVAAVRDGKDPKKIISQLYTGEDKDLFERKFDKLFKKYSKERQLDDADNEVLNMFSMIQPPAAIDANEYRAALWFNEQATKNIDEHVIEVEGGKIRAVKDVTEEERKKIDGFYEKILVPAEAVPNDFIDGAEKLANKYFIVKREMGGKIVYSPWLGNLPSRFASGEIRCAFEGENKG